MSCTIINQESIKGGDENAFHHKFILIGYQSVKIDVTNDFAELSIRQNHPINSSDRSFEKSVSPSVFFTITYFATNNL